VDVLAHFKYTLRKLARAPLFSVVAILTLGVGIGSNAAIFSVVNGVLLKPLPFDEPDRLVGIWHVAPGLGFTHERPINQSPALHFTYLDEGTAFESVGMWDDGTVSITGLAEPEQIDAMWVTHQTLPLLGVQASFGRVFTAEDDTPDTPVTIMLSHGYWQRRFGSDRGVLGQTLSVNGRSMEIIGVLPEGMRFIRGNPDVFMPFQWDRSEIFVGNFSYQGVGRLAEGATIASANADITRMIPMAIEQFPGPVTLGMVDEMGFAASARPLIQDVVGDVGTVLWVLLGTVAMVLMIACANVANLFIVRAEGRQREMALRTALGAERKQIVSQLLSESVMLGAAGGLLGLVLAMGGLRLLVALGPDSLPRLDQVGMDPSVLVFTAVISIAASVLFGLLPAVKYAKPNLVAQLKAGGRGGSAGKAQHFARNSLVVAQMALALVLLAGSGLMIRSFQALRAVEPGFSAPEEVLTFRVTIPSAEIEDGVEMSEAHQQILDRIREIPGVQIASMASSVTMDGFDNNDPVEVEGFEIQADEIPPLRRFKFIADEYFGTLGNTLVTGRTITRADAAEQALVVVVTENFAREYWQDPGAAIGKRLRVALGDFGGGAWHEIVGVVRDVYDDGVDQEPVSIMYWPQVTPSFYEEGIQTQRSMAYAVRTAGGNPTALLAAAREAVWAVNPNLPLARVRSLDEYLDRSLARTSFTLIMLGIAAAVALFLGSVGIYGVLSYVVAQRTREIGVRMAVGAEQGSVRRMVMKQALTLAAAGVAIGLVGALGLTRLMSSLLFGVSPVDPLTFGSVALGLSAVAMVASYVPARRASRVDPVVALRSE